MEKLRGYRVLSGTWGELWIDGEYVAELNKVEAKITFEREEIQTGVDMDTKFKYQKGEFNISLNKVFTRFEKYRKNINVGNDRRFQIISKLKDPDAVGAQLERYSFDNCWLNELPVVSAEKGSKVTQEITGGFTPSDMINLDEIKEV